MLQDGEDVGGASEVAVGLDPDLDPGASRFFPELLQRFRHQRASGFQVLPGLYAVAEDSDAGRVQEGGQPDRAPGLVQRAVALRSGWRMEERAGVHAGDGQGRVAQPGPRFAQAGAAELGAGPEGVVASHESQLHAVIAEPTRRVQDLGEAPFRAGQGGKAELHVIRSSMGPVTRLRTRRPRKKRSRSSRTVSAMAARTSRCPAATCGVRIAPRIRRSG